MRVALSSSNWACPAVHHILAQCDRIVTSNVDAYPQLSKLFGEHRIRIVQGLNEATVEFITGQYPGAEFVTYEDLRKAFRIAVKSGCVETIRSHAGYFGFEVSEVPLYDEEGVEGELWSGQGVEGYCLKGEVPEEVLAYLKRSV